MTSYFQGRMPSVRAVKLRMQTVKVRMLAVVLAMFSVPVLAGDVSLEVETKGQFVAPQRYQVSTETRIAALVNVWQLKPEAYRLGIAMLRESEKREQSRLRWGLIYQLKSMPINAATKASLTAQAERFVATGRVKKQFNWDLVEEKPKQNRLLKEGDTFVAPYRPASIQVAGAVESVSLPFVGGKAVADYAKEASRLPGADPSVVWVITPDTRVREIGVSYWNEEQAYLAPGSVLYVPLERHKKFNDAMVSLYAAQVLPY